MTKDEALTLALETLVKIPTLTHGILVKLSDVEVALHKALAQPEQWTPEDMAYRPGGLAQPEQMARLGWQYVECPACGSEGARAFPKPKQEPVAWFHLHNCEAYFTTEPSEDMLGNYWTPLYTSPPQRQPLTDEEIRQLWDDHTVPVFGKIGINPIVFARAIEAAHSIKENT